MTKGIKCMGLMIVALICLIGPAISAKAAETEEKGHTMNSAVPIELDQMYIKTWTHEDDQENAFYRVVIPEDGKVTFSFRYPRNSVRFYSSLNIEIYDSIGKQIWNFDGKKPELDIPSQTQCSFWVSLEAGTYYINLDYEGVLAGIVEETARSTFQLVYEWNTLCETEKNGSLATADRLELGYLYEANIGDNMQGKDFYKVDMQAGQTYYVDVANYKTIERETHCIWRLHMPNGESEYLDFECNTENSYRATVVARENGIYYIEMANVWCGEGRIPYDYQIGVFRGEKNGLDQTKNGNWYYYTNGVVNTDYTGLVEFDGSWWYVKDGVVDFATTLVPFAGQWWYVQNGAINFKATGLSYYEGNWWYVKNGVVDFTFNGIVPFGGRNWVVNKGVVVLKR